jgi:uncharacterized protein with NAD-binding domain and iron-sulfur cluster
MAKRVAILGGGVGGLSAAHELAERGFEVVVYEAHDIPGGKARSHPKPGSGTNGNKDLPGEHGFRFFPGFYRHLPDTMRRIPCGDKWVIDNLVGTAEVQLAREDADELLFPVHFPASPIALLRSFRYIFGGELGVGLRDLIHFSECLFVLLTTCHERRLAEYEFKSWWDFSGAGQRSEAYQKYFANGLTRSLVAARAHDMSTRTGGYILLQLMFDLARPGVQADRVLNGPTNEVWINPWVTYLRGLGVDYRTGAKVVKFDCADGRILGVTVEENGTQTRVEADYYIAAVPVEVMRELVTPEMKQADPQLGRLHDLIVEWMTGIQFYLRQDLKDVLGHTLYIDSDWALTSISQRYFWPQFDLSKCGNGEVQGILSVDISDWNKPGSHARPAKLSTIEEIKEEVWKQLKDHLNDMSVPKLNDDDLIDWFLDPAIQQLPSGELTNREPLLINTAGSWHSRPEAVTKIKNLFLSADYVRTNTDLATMESANEAARRAVNGILDDCGSTEPRCQIWKFKEPWTFAPLRAYDRWRFKRGRRHNHRIIRFAKYFVLPLWMAGHTLSRFVGRCARLMRLVKP